VTPLHVATMGLITRPGTGGGVPGETVVLIGIEGTVHEVETDRVVTEARAEHIVLEAEQTDRITTSLPEGRIVTEGQGI